MGAARSSGETLDTDFVSLRRSYCQPLVEQVASGIDLPVKLSVPETVAPSAILAKIEHEHTGDSIKTQTASASRGFLAVDRALLGYFRWAGAEARTAAAKRLRLCLSSTCARLRRSRATES